MENLLSPFKISRQDMFGWSLLGSLNLLNNLSDPTSKPLQYTNFFHLHFLTRAGTTAV